MTMKQIQNLLQFLGYYEGIPDGEYGPLTAQATENFQRAYKGIAVDRIPGEQTQKALRDAVAHGMPTYEADKKLEAVSLEELFRGIEYWSPEEFKCRCGEYHAPYCNGFPVLPNRKLLELADDVRRHFGRPGHRSSGIRCVQHNADQPGAAVNSRHLQGKALDFRIEGNTANQTLTYVNTLPGVRYAYAIDESYVHMDVE